MMDLNQINMNEVQAENQNLVRLNLVPFHPQNFISNIIGAYGVKNLFSELQSAILLPQENETHIIEFESDEDMPNIDLKNFSAKVVAEQNHEYLLALDVHVCPELVNLFNTNILFYGWVPKYQVRLIEISNNDEIFTIQ